MKYLTIEQTEVLVALEAKDAIFVQFLKANGLVKAYGAWLAKLTTDEVDAAMNEARRAVTSRAKKEPGSCPFCGETGLHKTCFNSAFHQALPSAQENLRGGGEV